MEEPRIRAIAVDEDGTFLFPGGTSYDKERFSRIYEVLRERGIRFAVATGNQVFQVRDYFAEIADEIGYVTSNGTYVHDGARELRAQAADPAAMRAAIDLYHSYPEAQGGIVGRDGVYIEKGSPQWVIDELELYSHRTILVDDLLDIPDEGGMFALFVPVADAERFKREATRALNGAMVVVDSGSSDEITYIDIVQPGISKADGLRVLLDEWGVSPDELVAFGDAGNDVQMIEMAGIGYAMANAADEVKAVADRMAPSNAESGVLRVLEELLGL